MTRDQSTAIEQQLIPESPRIADLITPQTVRAGLARQLVLDDGFDGKTCPPNLDVIEFPFLSMSDET